MPDICRIAAVCLSHMAALFLELRGPDTLTSMVISQITCPLGFLFVGFNFYFMFQIRSMLSSKVIFQVQLPEQFVRQCIQLRAAGIRGGVFHEEI